MSVDFSVNQQSQIHCRFEYTLSWASMSSPAPDDREPTTVASQPHQDLRHWIPSWGLKRLGWQVPNPTLGIRWYLRDQQRQQDQRLPLELDLPVRSGDSERVDSSDPLRVTPAHLTRPLERSSDMIRTAHSGRIGPADPARGLWEERWIRPLGVRLHRPWEAFQERKTASQGLRAGHKHRAGPLIGQRNLRLDPSSADFRDRVENPSTLATSLR